MIPIDSNRLPTIEEIQTKLTQDEIEAAQRDPQVLMIINTIINNNRDKYLSLLIQNGENMPPNVEISTIAPPRGTLNLNATQMPNASTTIIPTQSVAPRTQVASTQFNITREATISTQMLGTTSTRY